MKDKIIEGFKIITGVKYRELKEEWEDQCAMIDHLTWERNEARTKLGYEKKRVSGLRDDIKKLKDDFADERVEFDKKKAELRGLNDDLKKELARTDTELIEARVEIEELKREIEVKERVIEDLDKMLKQANSTDNVQPDCAEDIPETPWGPDHEEIRTAGYCQCQIEFDQHPNELRVTGIDVIPGEVHLNSEDVNLIYVPIDDARGGFVVRGEETCEAPKKKGRPKKATGTNRTTKTKTTATNKTTKKKK